MSFGTKAMAIDFPELFVCMCSSLQMIFMSFDLTFFSTSFFFRAAMIIASSWSTSWIKSCRSALSCK